MKKTINQIIIILQIGILFCKEEIQKFSETGFTGASDDQQRTTTDTVEPEQGKGWIVSGRWKSNFYSL
jgi:hypothetical protein